MSITRYEHPFGFNHFNKYPNFDLPFKLRVYLEGKFVDYLPDGYQNFISYIEQINRLKQKINYNFLSNRSPKVDKTFNIGQIVDNSVANLINKRKNKNKYKNLYKYINKYNFKYKYIYLK